MSDTPFENAQEVINYLFRAPNRVPVFLQFYDGDEDQEYLPLKEVNDSTESNTRSDLEEKGLLNKVGRGNYELTPVGKIAVKDVHNWMKDAKNINELFPLSQFLRQVHQLDEFLDEDEIRWLADSQIAVQDEETGRNHARNLYRQMIDEATEIREVIHRTYDPEYVRNELVNGDLESIFVVSSIDMEETVRSEEASFERWKDMYEHGSTHVSVEEIPIDYSVSIFDDEKVGILPTDPVEAGTNVYLVSSDKNVVEWASNLIQRYAEKGEESVPGER
jgi:predicted transcriptional regulator